MVVVVLKRGFKSVFFMAATNQKKEGQRHPSFLPLKIIIIINPERLWISIAAWLNQPGATTATTRLARRLAVQRSNSGRQGAC
jgi:hypothetical protein